MRHYDCLREYTEGLKQGDIRMLMATLDKNFNLELSNAKTVNRETFANYFYDFTAQITRIRGRAYQPLMEIPEIITQQDGANLMAWIHWTVPETNIVGNRLVEIGTDGILSEALAVTSTPEGH